jgi:hypothetical protein
LGATRFSLQQQDRVYQKERHFAKPFYRVIPIIIASVQNFRASHPPEEANKTSCILRSPSARPSSLIPTSLMLTT